VAGWVKNVGDLFVQEAVVAGVEHFTVLRSFSCCSRQRSRSCCRLPPSPVTSRTSLWRVSIGFVCTCENAPVFSFRREAGLC